MVEKIQGRNIICHEYSLGHNIYHHTANLLLKHLYFFTETLINHKTWHFVLSAWKEQRNEICSPEKENCDRLKFLAMFSFHRPRWADQICHFFSKGKNIQSKNNRSLVTTEQFYSRKYGVHRDCFLSIAKQTKFMLIYLPRLTKRALLMRNLEQVKIQTQTATKIATSKKNNPKKKEHCISRRIILEGDWIILLQILFLTKTLD